MVFKVWKNTENIINKFQKLVIIKKCYYQNVLYTIVKNQNLLNKKQKANGLLSSLGLKTPLDKISLLDDILY